MITESQRVRIEGHRLHRLVMHPEETVPVKAVAMFYHGQGDYAERYIEVLGPFTDRGIRCVVTDLPGHGLSPGRRGHCGDTELLDAVIHDTLSSMAVMEGMPYGIMGHSMGGLLAARHLVQSGMGEWPIPNFVWLSSPLVRPGHRRSPVYLMLIRWLARIFPSLTVSTGVTAQMCQVESVTEKKSPPEVEPKHQLWHDRVSMGWGTALLDFEKLVGHSLGQIPQDVPLLYTQGAEDPICLPELARGVFERLPSNDKQYHELEDVLHEPFRGDGSERLFMVLNDWLDGHC
ncbi:MAG: lysophospholipase [Verrucomicrobiae bacterium]|nr:lysophospholipase [Verrucomicrobiae bacterium]NNJ42348.1 alpha/beta fold hydrolase [Akkermansiaceae bacterium]